jgi:translation elongation factor EF-1beta
MPKVSGDNVKALDGFLSKKSYIEGWSFSAADTEVFATFAGAPCPVASPNAFRWYIHIAALTGMGRFSAAPAAPAAAAPAPAKKAAKKAAADDDDDDDDLFGDDDDEEADEKDPDAFFKSQGMSAAEIRKKKAQALAHAAKTMAKGSRTQVVFEVKPWESDCDLVALWKKIITNKLDGLVWGEGYNLVPVAFGVKKLVLSTVMDDQKIQSTEDIEDLINQYEDEVQSCDMTTMNRL